MDILLSIKPKWADLILERKKTVELRKRWTKSDDVDRVYLYSSSPVKKVVGWIELRQAVCEDVASLKLDSENESQVPSEDFDAYFSGHEKGWGLFISRAVRISPVLLPVNRPPQNWMHLTAAQSAALRRAE